MLRLCARRRYYVTIYTYNPYNIYIYTYVCTHIRLLGFLSFRVKIGFAWNISVNGEGEGLGDPSGSV